MECLYVGGGIFLAFQNYDLLFTRSKVTGNSAVSGGGGIYLGESHQRVRFDGVVISENTAAETAGGVYFSRFSSDIMLSSCQIRNNSAPTVSGMLVLADDMSITSSVFEHNKAQGEYGALHIQSSTWIEVTLSYFTNNVARGRCGAMSLSQTVNVTIKSALFLSNYAETGGAVCVADDCRNTTFVNTSFRNNVASVYAGALLVAKTANVFIVVSSFSDNTALTGDGSAIYISSSSVSLESSSFSGNKAPQGGGTVFWESSSDMQEPYGLTASEAGNYFSPSNTARYGSWWATEARYIMSENNVTSLEVVDYNKQNAPPITVLILDWYNQTVLSDSSSSLTVTVSTSVTSDCNGVEGIVGGSTRLTLLNGSATFNLLEPVCAPTYNLSLDVLSSLPSVTLLPFQYSFRSCVTGEYYAERVCKACEYGSFSFKDPQTVNMSDLTQASTCQSCVLEAESCFADVIVLKKNYWRISRKSTDIFECLYHDACNGGEEIGDEICSEGHAGPVCGVCTVGYTFSETVVKCVPCNSEGSLLSFLNVFILIILLLMFFFSAHYLYTFKLNKTVRDLADYQLYLLMKSGVCSLDDFENDRDNLRLYLINWQSRLEQICKSYVVLFQIISVLPFVLNLEFPSIFQLISSVLNIFNLHFSTSSIVTCSANGSYDYFTMLIIDTLCPVVFLFLLIIVNRIHVYCKTDIESEKVESSYINTRYYSIAIIFTYLILPGISVSIFGVFSCQEYDADGTVAGDNTYMTQDLSISCSSERYSKMYLYAGLMIFIYPIGIPLLYLYVLYRAKRYIIFPDEPLESREEEIKRSNILEAVNKLYVFYKPEFWYWELVEVFYRISLTGLLVLIKPGSSLQILTGLLFAVMFMKIYETASPYVDLDAQKLKNVCMYQIVGIFCIAVLVKGELFSDDYFLSVASVVLLTWNIVTYVTLVAFRYVSSKYLQYFIRNSIPSKEIGLTLDSKPKIVDLQQIALVRDSNIELESVHSCTRNPMSEKNYDTVKDV